MPQIPTPTEILRHALDRRLAIARGVRVLGSLGRIACATAMAWSIMLLLQRFTGVASGSGLTITVVTVAGAALGWPVVRGAIATWPTRLRIALAAERALPELGERISRAIGFLDEHPPHGNRGGSAALKALAIEQAASLADHIKQAPLVGAARDLLLAAAGSAAVAGLAMVTPWTGTTFPNTPTSGAAQPAAQPVTAETLAFRRQIEAARASIRAGATFERRLAAVLTGWLNAAPGVPDVEMLPRSRGLLAQAAALQDDCLAAIITAQKTLVDSTPLVAHALPLPADAEGISTAAQLLTVIDDTSRVESSAAIRAHRLAIATQTATRNADLLERAATLLGAAPAALASQSQFTDDMTPQTSRPAAERLLEQLERIAAVAVAPDAFATPDERTSDQGGFAHGPAAGPPAGAAGSATTTAPRFGTAAPPTTAVEFTSAEADGDRLWTLLPEQALRPRAADAAAYPSHRQAIDAYYRLLFEIDRQRATEESLQP